MLETMQDLTRTIISVPSSLILATVSLGFICFCVIWGVHRKNQPSRLEYPPIVVLEDELLFRHPRKAYEEVLQQHGKVVGVPRKGRLEYIVDCSLAHEVLTNDSSFSFEDGVMRILNLSPFSYFTRGRKLISALDTLVKEDIVGRIDTQIATIAPIFERRVSEITNSLDKDAAPVPLDLADFSVSLVSDAFVVMMFGKSFATEDAISAVASLSSSMADLTGIYQNIGWWSRNFPTLWRILTWCYVAGYSIPRNFLFGLGWSTLVDLNKPEGERRLSKDSLLARLALRYRDQDGYLRLADQIWLIFVMLFIMFAAVHQTTSVMVWTIYELALRPDVIDSLRSDFYPEVDLDGNECLSYASLRNAERVDSFIREVMRKKGDTLSLIRQTTKDVPLGGYMIPAGSLVIPLATLVHENETIHGEDASVFVSDRWVGRQKQATSIDSGYVPFGMGRWACPGRYLAVAEIKLLLLNLITKSTPMLKDGRYEVVDPLNVTSVPPRGNFMLAPRELSSN